MVADHVAVRLEWDWMGKRENKQGGSPLCNQTPRGRLGEDADDEVVADAGSLAECVFGRQERAVAQGVLKGRPGRCGRTGPRLPLRSA